jgi:hypothetical protein
MSWIVSRLYPSQRPAAVGTLPVAWQAVCASRSRPVGGGQRQIAPNFCAGMRLQCRKLSGTYSEALQYDAAEGSCAGTSLSMQDVGGAWYHERRPYSGAVA